MAPEKRGRVLVTGGAGYIGSHTCKALARQGFEPVVYDDLSSGHRDFVRWGPLVEGDIRDTERLAAALRDHGVAHVIHFAAESLVAKSMVQPHQFYSVNVGGTLALLEAMLRAGCVSLVTSSSCAIYGILLRSPVTETEPQQPVNPYGHSKSIVEAMLDDYRRIHAMRITALRYFNAAGADSEGDLGERHEPETHLIPRAVAAAFGGDVLDVYGTDFATPDGTAIRDYVHVTDLADAHLSALERHASGDSGGAFNLGSGRGHSVKEVLAAVETAVGKPVPARFVGRRAGDPPQLVADIALARARLDFDPVRSDIATIVTNAVSWYEKDHRAAVL